MKKILLQTVKLLACVVVFSFAGNTFAATTNTSTQPRNANADEAMLYTYLRYGGVVPDSLIETMKFRGTGFAATPSSFSDIIGTIAAQWVFGISPTGVTNYSSDMVTEGQNNKASSAGEANFLREIGAVAMGAIPTKGDTDIQSSDPYEQGKIKTLNGGVANIALSDMNSTGVFVRLMGAAIGRANNLAATAPDLHGMLPEQAGTRSLGETSNGQVLSDTISPFANQIGGIIASAAMQAAKATTLIAAPFQLAANLPAANADVPTSMTLPPIVAGTESQKKVTNPGMKGNGSSVGDNNKLNGYTNKNPGASLGNMQDALNYAERIQADQINNQADQLQNAREQFPNGRLEQLLNQFSPDTFKDLLSSFFSNSGGNNTGETTPSITPTAPTNECNDPTLSQQEVVDIAKFVGLPTSSTNWTVSYFKAQQLVGQSVYLSDSTTQTTLDTNIIPDGNACIWVVYAPSVKTGVFVSDVRSANGTKFMFAMP